MHYWIEQNIGPAEEALRWYERGTGPEVLFLHGNWDPLMYAPVLETHARTWRPLLLRQRGVDCWRNPGSYNALPLDGFLADIQRLRLHKGIERLAIIGHSWGASLALHYACAFPQHVDRHMLIGMGPVSSEMSRFYQANVRRQVHPDRRSDFERISKLFSQQFASGQGIAPEVDEQYAELHKTVWAYSAAGAEQIKLQYLSSGGYKRTAAGSPRGDPEALLKAMTKVTCPTLIVYGYQDYEPITQAYLIQQHIPHAQIHFINQCSHCPWIDQPEEFERLLQEFVHGPR